MFSNILAVKLEVFLDVDLFKSEFINETKKCLKKIIES